MEEHKRILLDEGVNSRGAIDYNLDLRPFKPMTPQKVLLGDYDIP